MALPGRLNEVFSMNGEISSKTNAKLLRYIEMPHSPIRPEKIDAILQRRMREFMLRRRQKQWQERGE